MIHVITGGAGFIGTNYIRYILKKYPSDRIICADKLTYAGNRDNLKELEKDERFIFEQVDICDRKAVCNLFRTYRPDCVVNFAAESHVDRSIENPEIFLKTNVMGTGVLLDAVNEMGVTRFHQISTDEVYGDLAIEDTDVKFSEKSILAPSSPYSASKASADLLCLCCFRTYNTPVTISRSSNNYGPYQFPEKLIPVVIEKALRNEAVPVYGDGKNAVRRQLQHLFIVIIFSRSPLQKSVAFKAGNQMPMHMEYCLPGGCKVVLHYIQASCAGCLNDCFTQKLHCAEQLAPQLRGHVKHIGIMFFRDYKNMTVIERADIQECKQVIAGKNLNKRDFALLHCAKNTI